VSRPSRFETVASRWCGKRPKYPLRFKEGISPAPFRNLLTGNKSLTSSERTTSKSHEIGIDQLKAVKPRLRLFSLEIAQLDQHRRSQPRRQR
jgi:hypothetical protein